jgi:microcin C transport system substrate-binding protein
LPEARATRRAFLVGAGALGVASAIAPGRLDAADPERESHGMSIFGDLRYGPDFRHFAYVNPAAPEGRRVLAPDRLDGRATRTSTPSTR